MENHGGGDWILVGIVAAAVIGVGSSVLVIWLLDAATNGVGAERYADAERYNGTVVRLEKAIGQVGFFGSYEYTTCIVDNEKVGRYAVAGPDKTDCPYGVGETVKFRKAYGTSDWEGVAVKK